MRDKKSNKEYMNKYRFIVKVEWMKKKKTLCAVCREQPAATLHHRDEDQNNNQNSNLLPVCRKCHLEIPHQCDEKSQPTLGNALVFIRKPVEQVLQHITPSYATPTGVTAFRKGNLTLNTQVSLRVQHLIESWGFKRI